MASLPINLQDVKSSSGQFNNTRFCLHRVSRRHLVVGLTCLVCFTVLLLHPFRGSPPRSSRWPDARLPPLYSQYHTYELQLPQHRWNAGSHEMEPRFLFVKDHSRGSGWGNIMQEILLNAYLAYKTDRAFVFYNYTWNDDGSDYSDYAGKPIPSRVPLSALIQGPIIGAAYPHGEHAPPAIAEQYWHTVCEGQTVSVSRNEVHKDLGWMAAPLTQGWIARLAGDGEQCVQVSDGCVYDWLTFGDRHALHDLWNDFSSSPIITHFGWSPLVELAFDNNREVIAPSTIVEPPLSSTPYTSNADRYSRIDGLLVLHLRRGDYEQHCNHLAKWSSTFLAFNALPQLEQFDPPPGGDWGENTPENYEIYREHCFPTTEQIIKRIKEVQRSEAAKNLENVYIMTNGAVEWVQELKDALKELGGFKHVSSSRDLVLNWEQKYVAQAMDMLVGQRAEVFIGNGWSSLTGGIVVMRTANGFHPHTTRFF